MDTLVKCECGNVDTTWVDCPKEGHEEGCFGTVCVKCDHFAHLDCEGL